MVYVGDVEPAAALCTSLGSTACNTPGMGGEGQWQGKHAHSQKETTSPGKAGTEVQAISHFASKIFANVRH